MHRIGYLVPEFPSQTHIWMWREIVAMREHGADVRIVSTRRPPLESCRHAFAGEARETTHYLFPPRVGAVLSGLASMPSAMGYVSRRCESGWRDRLRVLFLSSCACDLLIWSKRFRIRHIHSHSCADAAHVVAMCRAMGGPEYSLTLHGDLPVYGVDHRAKMGRAKFVATAGEHLIDSVVREAGVDPRRVFSNPMGVDTDRFVDLERRQSDPGRIRLLTVARLHRCKGHVLALRAARRLMEQGIDVRYTLAGDGPHRDEIESEVKSIGLVDRVDLLGSVSEDRVLDLMQTHDVFVLSSIGAGEAAPVGVMEAMSCGMPVVCSRIGSTPQMIEDGRTGVLVDQADVDGLVTALLRLARDVKLREAIGREARAYARAHFDSRAGAERLLSRISSED
jgi:glycosyltransferase involved in cell wall biosynthesis